MRTGEVAASAGVNAQTLRYYERRGLLPRPKRTEAGYREYPPDAVRLLRFIKRAQELGFTLDEIEEFLRLRDDKDTSCAEVQAAAEAKIRDIETRMASLRAMRQALRQLVGACCERRQDRSCPILDALDAPAKKGASHGRGAAIFGRLTAGL